jgi:hypothetical protein
VDDMQKPSSGISRRAVMKGGASTLGGAMLATGAPL